MNEKDLKKLAKACRAAGIKHYKDQQVEFTLTDDYPIITRKKKSKTNDKGELLNNALEAFKTDTLTESQLLLWSVGAEPNESQ
jgi:hypothetical protein